METHLRDLLDLLEWLQWAGLMVHSYRCMFAVTELGLLSHHVTVTGITPQADKVAAIHCHPRPTTIR